MRRAHAARLVDGAHVGGVEAALGDEPGQVVGADEHVHLRVVADLERVGVGELDDAGAEVDAVARLELAASPAAACR